MGEDKLTHAQRVRLEALSQAINTGMVVRITRGAPAGAVMLHGDPAPTMADVFQRAEDIEAWLLAAKEPGR